MCNIHAELEKRADVQRLVPQLTGGPT